MPLPSDEKIVQLGRNLLAQFDAVFGLHPGFRPAHAKGILVTGTFTPATEARSLTRAPHLTRNSTPVTVRFSDSTGFPSIPDNDANSNPRGLAIRFHLADHVHTDIISHSTDGFPTRTGEEFLEFLMAVAEASRSKQSPSSLENFLGTHPAALAFVQTPKPNPASFASEAYFGVTAYCFTNRVGAMRYGRYRIMPEAGIEHLDDAVAKAKAPNYLFDEIARRIEASPIRLKIAVQVAEPGDIVDDSTIHWPSDRVLIKFGTVELTTIAVGNEEQQRQIIFDPIPRVDGIEASADPLLELRAALYLLSGRRRRQAIEPHSSVSGA